MARKLFSFLGTGKYEPCYYYLAANGQKIKDKDYRCYVQESLINLLPKIDFEVDEINIFLTKEAKSKNWLSNSNKEYDMPGLRDTLTTYSSICTITPVGIPSGNSEQELWEIFDIIFEQIEAGDEIIFDITHSFRSTPILAIIILNYAKFVRGCEIVGIYYGAIEALCSYQELVDMPIKDRICPIFDITSFVELLDWTVGIDKFITTGDVRQVVKLIDKERERLGRLGEANLATFFNQLKNSINSFVGSVATCRGKDVSKKALELKNKLGEVIDRPELSNLKPIRPLLVKMKNELEGYCENEHLNMIRVVKWCCEHNLVQQGITILQEGLVTYLCEKYSLDPNEWGNRKIINQIVNIKSRSRLFKDWKDESKKRKELVYQLLEDEFFGQIAILLNKMISVRNDINHSSWVKGPSKPEQIESKLNGFIMKAEKLLKGEIYS